MKWLVVLGLLLSAAGCGHRAAIRVTVEPGTATALLGDTVPFAAAVSGTPDRRVRWSLQGAGEITPDGLYIAPAAMPETTSVLVTATSLADPARHDSATVTLIGD